MASSWQLEMENMLAAFNRQTIHSLSIIRLAFKRSDLSFTPEFKQHFMHASTNCINEAYDQFQVSSLLQEWRSPSLDSTANVSKRSARNDTNEVEWETDDHANSTSIGDESGWRTNASDSTTQIDDSGDDDGVSEPVEDVTTDDEPSVGNGTPSNADAFELENVMSSTSNDGPMATDELHGVNESMCQTNVNASYIVDPEASSDLNFAVEMEDSNDSIELIENQINSTDADDKELIPMNVVLNRLDETNSAELTKGKSKSTRLNRKNSCKKWLSTTTGTQVALVSAASKGKKSLSKRSVPKNPKKCTVCGYVSRNGHLNRHMRIHTGEQPYRCDRCGRRFTNAQSIIKHAATHIAEFPFHCRVCFHGFSLKSEATAHENRCQKRHYECCLCKKLVTCAKTDLIIHMRKHNGNKPFRCEICCKHFFQRSNLKRHLNTIHSRNNS